MTTAVLVRWAIHLCGLLGDSNENKPLVGAEEEEVAKMGCPSLGEHTQVEVIIEESYEFKVSVGVCLCTYCICISFLSMSMWELCLDQFDFLCFCNHYKHQFHRHHESCVECHHKNDMDLKCKWDLQWFKVNVSYPCRENEWFILLACNGLCNEMLIMLVADMQSVSCQLVLVQNRASK